MYTFIILFPSVLNTIPWATINVSMSRHVYNPPPPHRRKSKTCAIDRSHADKNVTV